MPVASPTLPAPRRTDAAYRVAMVCLGNICRSPMAEVVLADRVARAGLAERVEVVSAGTGDWHVGHPMDRRAAAVLTEHGYDASRHRARQIATAWLDECDLVLTMDAANHADVTALAAAPGGPGSRVLERVRMFRDFDPEAGHGDRDVPDPYYGGNEGFAGVLAIVQRTADALTAALADLLDGGRAD